MCGEVGLGWVGGWRGVHLRVVGESHFKLKL